MTTKDIKTVLILVEFENGNAHQVLATKEHKKIMIDLLATMSGGLKLSEEIEPLTLNLCEK